MDEFSCRAVTACGEKICGEERFRVVLWPICWGFLKEPIANIASLSVAVEISPHNFLHLSLVCAVREGFDSGLILCSALSAGREGHVKWCYFRLIGLEITVKGREGQCAVALTFPPFLCPSCSTPFRWKAGFGCFLLLQSETAATLD